jgi:hypothetical protein
VKYIEKCFPLGHPLDFEPHSLHILDFWGWSSALVIKIFHLATMTAHEWGITEDQLSITGWPLWFGSLLSIQIYLIFAVRAHSQREANLPFGSSQNPLWNYIRLCATRIFIALMRYYIERRASGSPLIYTYCPVDLAFCAAGYFISGLQVRDEMASAHRSAAIVCSHKSADSEHHGACNEQELLVRCLILPSILYTRSYLVWLSASSVGDHILISKPNLSQSLFQ